jgi:hypothetical protein
MAYVKLSEQTMINLDQIQYCKMSRIPIEGQLVPNSLIQIFFAGGQEPVQFEGTEAERLWQAMEYRSIDNPNPPLDVD